MNTIHRLTMLCGVIWFSGHLAVQAQDAASTSAPPKAAGITASLNKSLGLYVFPAKGQDAATQAADETACFDWAVEQSGVNPLNMEKAEAAEVDKGPDGTVARGAVKGAIVGTVIGAIAGDAGDGAAIGAGAGGVGGVLGKRDRDKNAQESAETAANQQHQDKISNFKKAYSACLEGKGYTVK